MNNINQPPKKVLFFIESLGGGGAEKVLSTIIEHIDTRSFDVSVCAICGGGIYESIINESVTYSAILPANHLQSVFCRLSYRIKYKLIYQLLPLWLVYLWIVPKGFDVEVAFVEGFATKLLAHSFNRQSKKIAWVHCNLLKDHWTSSVFKNIAEERSCYSRYDKIITVSNTQKQAFTEVFGDMPVEVCYNPVDTDRIHKLAAENDNTILSKNRFRVVSVGRLQKVKGFMRLLLVVERLLKENYDVELWLIGDGDEKQILEQYTNNSILKGHVCFWGFQANPYKYMSKCDLFICSSYSEGFCTAITESLVLGIPVVSTEVSGVFEQFGSIDKPSGIITKNDTDALYFGIKHVLDNPQSYYSFKKNSFERGADFHLATLMKGIEDALMN